MNILAFSCLHMPYSHAGAVPFLARLKSQYSPDTVIFLGDLVDRECRQIDGMRFDIFDLFPNVLACIGNHDKALCADRSPSEFYGSPAGWVWQYEHFIAEVNLLARHGDASSRPALDMAISCRCNIVGGHYHASAGVVWSCISNQLFYGLSVGCLTRKQPSTARSTGSVGGAAVIVGGVPRFIPMEA